MISLDEARAIIAHQTQPLEASQVPLNKAYGAMLREDIAAREDMPAFDRSSMDGYAVGLDDASERFRVIGEVTAGAAKEISISSGECVRIFTGAAIPLGASQVIPQEAVRREGEWMIPLHRDRITFIRKRGEDACRGDVLLRTGTRLDSGALALLADCGVTTVLATRRARAVHFTTGDELVNAADTPLPGQIRDSNSILVRSLLEEGGVELVLQARCRDDLGALVERLRNVPSNSWDLLLLSGGASVGDYDFGARALEVLGFTLHFRQINVRPGKPLIFATRGSQLAFVIPGNPVSHFVTFHTAIAAALDRLAGSDPGWPIARLPLGKGTPLKSNPRETYWPARLEIENGVLTAVALHWQSSGDLRGLVGARALIRIRPNEQPPERGSLAECLLLSV